MKENTEERVVSQGSDAANRSEGRLGGSMGILTGVQPDRGGADATIAAEGPSGGLAAVGGVAGVPPILSGGTKCQNTGVTEEKATVGVHWFQATIFASSDDILEYLGQGFTEEYLGKTFKGWLEKTGSGRLNRRFEACDGHFKLTDCRQDLPGREDYCQLTLTGEACELVGWDGVLNLFQSLPVEWRANIKRLDVAWDGCGFTVDDVEQAFRAGNICGRSFVGEDGVVKGFHPHHNRDGSRGLNAPDRTAGGSRSICVYDRRETGTRFELRLHGGRGYENDLFRRLILLGKVERARLLRDVLWASIGFIYRASDERIERCVPLEWWGQFCEGADKRRAPKLSRPDSRTLTEIGKLEGVFQRSARSIMAAAEAYGWDYVEKRLAHYGQERMDWELVERLRAYSQSGLAGLPTWSPASHQDLPF